jgi:hypothetical protein
MYRRERSEVIGISPQRMNLIELRAAVAEGREVIFCLLGFLEELDARLVVLQEEILND